MKLIYKCTLFFLCISIYTSAQVGINTNAPQSSVLHIDGQGNNSPTGTPTAAETTDDVLISSVGNVAIGHINPAYKLDVRVPDGSKKAAFRLEDGTEGNTKILLSDASGNAYWGFPGGISMIRGIYTQAINYTIPNRTYIPNMYMNAYIQLPPGRWVVMLDQRVEPTASSYGTSSEQRSFIRFTFSDNNLTGDGNLIPANGAGVSKDIEGTNGGTITTGALISGNMSFRTPTIISGFVIINNQTNAVKTYYLKLVNPGYPTFQNLTGRVVTAGNPAHTESKMIAMPLQ